MKILIQTDLGLRSISMSDETSFMKNEPMPGWLRFFGAPTGDNPLGENVYLQEAFVAGIVPDDCTVEPLS